MNINDLQKVSELSNRLEKIKTTLERAKERGLHIECDSNRYAEFMVYGGDDSSETEKSAFLQIFSALEALRDGIVAELAELGVTL